MWAGEPVLGPRLELVHRLARRDTRIFPAAIAVGRDGIPLAAWFAQDGSNNTLYFARVTGPDAPSVRVNPDGMEVASLENPPGIAVGPAGEIYLSWSSSRYGAAFGANLQLSRSLDGGRRFDRHLAVNEDRAAAHSFEGVTVGADGTVFVAWTDDRDSPDTAGTYVARVVDRGGRIAGTLKLDSMTCRCCRVSVATGPPETVVAAWRRVFSGDLRDIVLATSRDGGRGFTSPTPVHEDRWKITACPRRGPNVALDARGRLFAVWYTEGPDGEPKILFAVAPDGRRFGDPLRVNTSTVSIPDHPRLAVAPGGLALVVWEEETAVRRRVLMRYSPDGRSLGRERILTEALKSPATDIAPDIAVTPGGDFVVAWQEKRSMSVTTVLQTVRVDDERAAPQLENASRTPRR